MSKKVRITLLFICAVLEVLLATVFALYSVGILDGLFDGSWFEKVEKAPQENSTKATYTIHLDWGQGRVENFKYDPSQPLDLSARISNAENEYKMFFEGWYTDANLTKPFLGEALNGSTIYAQTTDAVIIRVYGLNKEAPMAVESFKIKKYTSFDLDEHLPEFSGSVVFGLFNESSYETTINNKRFIATADENVYVKYSSDQNIFTFAVADGKAKILSCGTSGGSVTVPPAYKYLMSNYYQVTELADGSFSGLSITELVLPNTIKKIGKNAFKNCNRLTKIVIYSAEPPQIGQEAIPDNVTIFVPADSVETYKTAEGWSAYAERIVGR